MQDDEIADFLGHRAVWFTHNTDTHNTFPVDVACMRASCDVLWNAEGMLFLRVTADGFTNLADPYGSIADQGGEGRVHVYLLTLDDGVEAEALECQFSVSLADAEALWRGGERGVRARVQAWGEGLVQASQRRIEAARLGAGAT